MKKKACSTYLRRCLADWIRTVLKLLVHIVLWVPSWVPHECPVSIHINHLPWRICSFFFSAQRYGTSRRSWRFVLSSVDDPRQEGTYSHLPRYAVLCWSRMTSWVPWRLSQHFPWGNKTATAHHTDPRKFGISATATGLAVCNVTFSPHFLLNLYVTWR